MKRGGLDSPTSIFAHGQTYVGFSRVGDDDEFFVWADQSEFDNIRDHFLEPGQKKLKQEMYGSKLKLTC